MQIQGSKFTLRNWQITDASALAQQANNINVSSWLGDRFPFPYTLDDATGFIKGQIDQTPVVNFAIAINGQVIGGISLNMRNDIYRKTPLLGYWLGEQHWGNGIITEAIKLITAYAFRNFNIICIQACVFGENNASMRVLEKSGFIKQGVFKQSLIKRGEIFDEHVYAVYNT